MAPSTTCSDAGLNPASLQVVEGAMLEASLAGAAPGSRWQLERVGYFMVDPVDSGPVSYTHLTLPTNREV